jgi:GPH family glycoside/pentoside/hexuronide:cation symporter
VVGSIALIVALPLSKPLAQRFGKRNVFIGSSILSGSFFTLLYLPGAESLGWVYALNVLGKMAYAPAVPLLWTMIADAADYGEWTTGRRATGLFFSAATFAQKGGWGIGGALAGWLLAAYGYVEQAAEQTALALTGIKLLISVFPGVLYVSCAFILIFYTIDEATCATMKRELEARRAAEAAGENR